MIFAKTMFGREIKDEQSEEDVHKKMRIQLEDRKMYTQDVIEFVLSMICYDPRKRPTALQVDQFFKSKVDVSDERHVSKVRTRLYQLKNGNKSVCMMDDRTLQGDKIIKITGGNDHLIVLTSNTFFQT
jgi:hypothetical protein